VKAELRQRNFLGWTFLFRRFFLFATLKLAADSRSRPRDVEAEGSRFLPSFHRFHPSRRNGRRERENNERTKREEELKN